MAKSRKTTCAMGNAASDEQVKECKLIASRYVMGEEIDRGTFCAVRKAYDKRRKLDVAIKMEKKNSKKPELHRENDLYKLLRGLPGIPRTHGMEECGEYYAMVLDLLGPSIDSYLKECGGIFSIKTVLLFAVQAVALLENVHKRGIVYRDIKPQNFLTAGPRAEDSGNIFYIVDFGLAATYWNKERNQHIPYKETGSRIGTARYMSINAHMGIEQSRRDDLEALGYLLFYMLSGKLPWMNQHADDRKEKNKKIMAIKKDCDIEKLGEPHPPEFVEYLKYAKSLEFSQNPDYKYITELFEKAIRRLKIIKDQVYDWNEKEHSVRVSAGAKEDSQTVESCSKQTSGTKDTEIEEAEFEDIASIMD